MRRKVWYRLKDVSTFKTQLFEWSRQYDEIAWLDSNYYDEKYGSFEAVLAVDSLTSISTDAQNAFENLREYQNETKDWIFGYLSYDLKNDVEHLSSENHDGLDFSDPVLFQPKKIITISENQVTFNYLNMIGDEIESDFKNDC